MDERTEYIESFLSYNNPLLNAIDDPADRRRAHAQREAMIPSRRAMIGID